MWMYTISLFGMDLLEGKFLSCQVEAGGFYNLLWTLDA
jgi:hypothetical protein